MLCDLAIAVLEEIVPEFESGILNRAVVYTQGRDGLRRYNELTQRCARKPSIPSIVINEHIVFNHIPDFDALSEAVRKVFEY